MRNGVRVTFMPLESTGCTRQTFNFRFFPAGRWSPKDFLSAFNFIAPTGSNEQTWPFVTNETSLYGEPLWENALRNSSYRPSIFYWIYFPLVARPFNVAWFPIGLTTTRK